MNKLSTERRAKIIHLLMEGMSMRAVARAEGVSFNTVTKLLSDAGDAADAWHRQRVRGITGRRHLEVDEIWSFIYAKEGNVIRAKSAPEEAGDVWTFTALDADSKLLTAYLVGPRDGQSALAFMDDLRSRIEERQQITTDGLSAYREAVDGAFGGDVDYAQVIKSYGNQASDDRSAKARYSPAACTGIEKVVVWGDPDMTRANTSYVERSNLTMRMSMRRFTRLTNAFSKRLTKHCATISLYSFFYNWVRPHRSLRTKGNNRVTPAMSAGLTDRQASVEELVRLIDKMAPPVNYARKYRSRKPAGV